VKSKNNRNSSSVAKEWASVKRKQQQEIHSRNPQSCAVITLRRRLDWAYEWPKAAVPMAGSILQGGSQNMNANSEECTAYQGSTDGPPANHPAILE
jgi:hypothetical protein